MIKRGRVFQMFICMLAAFFIFAMVAPGQAEAATEKEREIEELREKIDALPDRRDDVTEEDKPAIKEAVEMRDRLMAEYGITEYDICPRAARLAKLEREVDVEELPPTGGVATPVVIGLISILAGAGLLIPAKREG